MKRRLGVEEGQAEVVPKGGLEYDKALLKIDDEVAHGFTLNDREMARRRLDRITDQLLETSGAVIRDMLAYADVDFDPAGNLTSGVPEKWDIEFANDPEGLARRIRMAKFGQMNTHDSPNANRLAVQTYCGILKARAREEAGPRTLNVAVVQLTAAPPQFEVQEIE